jgi:hypothetical protein
VTIMDENAGTGWAQGWGALDPLMRGKGNFIRHETDHLGYWLDLQFVKFYNENSRLAGTYTWTSSYAPYPSSRYTVTWSYSLPQTTSSVLSNSLPSAGNKNGPFTETRWCAFGNHTYRSHLVGNCDH